MFKKALTIGVLAAAAIGYNFGGEILELGQKTLGNNELLAELGLVDVIERQTEAAVVKGVRAPVSLTNYAMGGETTYSFYEVDCEAKFWPWGEKKCKLTFWTEGGSYMGSHDVTLGNGYARFGDRRWVANYLDDDITVLQDGKGRIHSYRRTDLTGFRF